MTYTAIEWIALIFVVAGLIKMIVILVNRKAWLPVIDAVYGNPKASTPVFIILAGIVLYYLLQTMTIVQIMAAATFTALLVASAFASYGKDLVKLSKKMLNQSWGFWLWIYVLVWIALMGWTAYEIIL